MDPEEIHRSGEDGRNRPPGRRRWVAVAVIAAADLAIMAWGLLALFSPEVLAPGYEQYTGSSWVALTQDAPEVADFLLLAFRLVGALNVAVAIPLIAIALTAFRARERWAWWTLFVGNTVALGAPMAYDQLGRSGCLRSENGLSWGRCTRRWHSRGAVEATRGRRYSSPSAVCGAYPPL